MLFRSAKLQYCNATALWLCANRSPDRDTRELVAELLERGANANTRDGEAGSTPLEEVIRRRENLAADTVPGIRGEKDEIST